MVKCESKNKDQKRHVLKGYWPTCSIYVNHFLLNNQYNWMWGGVGGGERGVGGETY